MDASGRSTDGHRALFIADQTSRHTARRLDAFAASYLLNPSATRLPAALVRVGRDAPAVVAGTYLARHCHWWAGRP